MELKFKNKFPYLVKKERSNCTFMELKLVSFCILSKTFKF